MDTLRRIAKGDWGLGLGVWWDWGWGGGEWVGGLVPVKVPVQKLWRKNQPKSTHFRCLHRKRWSISAFYLIHLHLLGRSFKLLKVNREIAIVLGDFYINRLFYDGDSDHQNHFSPVINQKSVLQLLYILVLILIPYRLF